MNTAQSTNLLTLKQAADILGVSIETLLSWNQANILKPTITPTGEVGYTQNQVDQFVTIQQLMKKTPEEIFPQKETPVYLKPEIVIPNRSNEVKPPSAFVVVSLSVILLVLASTIFPTESKQTSKLNLSEKLMASLPIQLRNETTQKRNLHNEGESISKEKMTGLALYQAKQDTDILAMQTQQQDIEIPAKKFTGNASGISETDASSTFASAAYFPEENADDSSAIDESGKIKGEAKEGTLAAVVGDINGKVSDGSLEQVSTDATNQLFFLFAGGLIALYVLQRQFAFPTKRLQFATREQAFMPTYTAPVIAQEKTLEIDQKTDGTVVLYVQGKEYKISKPELNSESDQFIETLLSLMQNDLQEIEYDAQQSPLRLTTPLSRLVTRLGFVGIKRDLFFPRTSKNSVLFRKYLTQKDLDRMNLTTSQIVNELSPLS